MQNTDSIESILPILFSHPLSNGNRNCVGGWEAGEERYCGWGDDSDRGKEGVVESKYIKGTDNIRAIILNVLLFF